MNNNQLPKDDTLTNNQTQVQKNYKWFYIPINACLCDFFSVLQFILHLAKVLIGIYYSFNKYSLSTYYYMSNSHSIIQVHPLIFYNSNILISENFCFVFIATYSFINLRH